jgi:hypothetical protein
MSHRLAQSLLLGVTLVASTGCYRVYEAEVSGFVKDIVSEEGINGAQVRILFNDQDETSYQETLTQTYNGADGYFVFRRVVWGSWTPVFGDEGDLRDIRLEVEADDYVRRATDLRVVSGAANAVGDVLLSRTFFVSERVEGIVRDREEDRDDEHPGINGLTVELYIPDIDVTSPEDRAAWVQTHAPDATANTQTNDGDEGFYAFDNVRFEAEPTLPDPDENPYGTPRDVILRVEDSAHFTELVTDAVIYSGEVASILDDVFVDKERYEGDVEGVINDLTTGEGLNGATVDIYVPDEPLADQAAVEAFVDDHDPVASANTQTNDDEDDGTYTVTGVDWEIDDKPAPDEAHQRTPIIIVVDSGGYNERILFDDPDAAGFEPAYFARSNQTVIIDPIAVERTDFRGNLEGYVRLAAGVADEGENGVQISLYYDPDDPDLTELVDFDPFEADFNDQTSTADVAVQDETWPGYFSFTNIGWNRDGGGSLTGGRDTMTVILYSSGVDFSAFDGNTDPSWQRFTVVSDDGDDDLEENADITTLSDLQFRPTQFVGGVEGHIRQTAGDIVSGENGVELRLYYDPEDRDLSELGTFDPDGEVEWSQTLNTQNQQIGDDLIPGYFLFEDLNWRNRDGPTVGLDRDTLTFILFSYEINLSGMPGNTDPRWNRFTITSGTEPQLIGELPYFRTQFVASITGYVREVGGDPTSGENGVELKLYYDADDPMLQGLTAFDPSTVEFVDVTNSRDAEVGDETYPGSFTFNEIFWNNWNGPSLAGGRDQAAVILYAPDVDFSGYEGNTDPTWQRFTIVSGPDGNQLADLPYLAPPEPFSAQMDGFVRAVVGDSATGENGVTLQLYYDPDDPDLTDLGTFDPSTAAFADQASTKNITVGDSVYPGGFTFSDVTWERLGGGTLANGKDTIRVIVYAPDVDFAGFDGNSDPTWQIFELVSGADGNTLPDLPLVP